MTDPNDDDVRLFYCVADLDHPQPEPFAVLEVDTSKRIGAGVSAIVKSLHMTREDAEMTAEAHKRNMQ